MDYKQDNLFGWQDPIEEVKASLFDKFIVPPFSVLDRRQGYWQNRKRTWLRLGIKSELGRDEHLCFNLNSFDADTDKAVRQGQAQADAPSTSVFDPVLCELAYTWFCPKGGAILDPFCGGSVRGIVACQLGYKYTGIDLRDEQIQENRKQAKEILGDEGASALNYITGDSDSVLDCIGNANVYDFAFTCPPYFDLEVYSDNPKDISNMDWEGFKKAYASILGKACNLLRQDAFFGIVIGDVRGKDGCFKGLPNVTQIIMKKNGFGLYDDFILIDPLGSASMRADKQFTATRKCVTTHQRFMVFLRGDPRKAKGEN